MVISHEALWRRAQAFKEYRGFSAAIDEFIKYLGVERPEMPEPSRGSVVRHPDQSIVWVRLWGSVDGERSWGRSAAPDTEREREVETWDEILDFCLRTTKREPVIILDTKGKGSYDSL